MASKFYALDLNNGDAFLLLTNHNRRQFSVLVDGGKKSKGNPLPLVEAIKRADSTLRHLNVVICTHRDADHVNGLQTLADGWYAEGRTIGEFWLPGSLSVAVPHVFTDPVNFTTAILEGAEEAAERLSGEHRSFSESHPDEPFFSTPLSGEEIKTFEERLRDDAKNVLREHLKPAEVMEELDRASFDDDMDIREEGRKARVASSLGLNIEQLDDLAVSR